jgi:soluble lytic murein transglycosylase
MRGFLPFCLIVFIILSCSTHPVSILPPSEFEYLPPNLDFIGDRDRQSLDLQLLGVAAKYPGKNVQWWAAYRRARLWEKDKPGTSCLLYLDLSQNPHFPIKQIALLRAFSTCDRDDLAKFRIEQLDQRQFPEWIRPLSLDIALRNSRRDKDIEANYDLALQKSKLAIGYEEKVKLLQEAVDIAPTLADPGKLKIAQTRLYRIAPRFKPDPRFNEYLDVAYDYRRAREFDKARLFYQKVYDSEHSSFDNKIKAIKGIRSAYKVEQKKPEYLQKTLVLSSYIEKSWRSQKRPSKLVTQQYHEAQVTLARTYWTLGQASSAQKILFSLAKKLKGKYPLDEIYWLQGRMAEERGHYQEASDWFEKGIGEINEKKQQDSLERILWYQAWNLRKLRKYSEAHSALEVLITKAGSEFSRSRYTYWLAITKKNLEKFEEAKILLASLIKDDPIGYYGLMAHRELQTPVSIPGLNPSEAKSLENSFSQSQSDDLVEGPFVEWLISVGEKDVANLYLDHVSANYRKRPNQDEGGWVRLFRYYASSGVYLGLYNQLGLLEPAQRNSILNHFPHLIFPTPYKEYVANASNRYGVSSDLIYSIMRQESAFDPAARSHADAFGLMQLLPEVARNTARQVQFEFENAEELYEPHINIPLGSAYLRELWDKFNGQFILTVASYNASEEAIYGWLRTRFRGDTLEFIEDIPYEETRSYVRLVMRNLVFYSLINSGGKAIPFPEWTLALSIPSSQSNP